jgi:hypothetical protein
VVSVLRERVGMVLPDLLVIASVGRTGLLNASNCAKNTRLTLDAEQHLIARTTVSTSLLVSLAQTLIPVNNNRLHNNLVCIKFPPCG